MHRRCWLFALRNMSAAVFECALRECVCLESNRPIFLLLVYVCFSVRYSTHVWNMHRKQALRQLQGTRNIKICSTNRVWLCVACRNVHPGAMGFYVCWVYGIIYMCVRVIPYTGIYPLWTDLLFIFRFLLLWLLLLLPYSHLFLEFPCVTSNPILFLFFLSSLHILHMSVCTSKRERERSTNVQCVSFLLCIVRITSIFGLFGAIFSACSLKNKPSCFFFSFRT